MNSTTNFFDNLIDNQNFEKVLGEGSYSIVWDIGGKAYKLTSEIEPKQAKEIQKINNFLAESGVNVPYIFDVDVFDADPRQTVLNIKSMFKNSDKRKTYNLLKKYCDGIKESQQGRLVGIKQQKLDGITCFDFVRYENIRRTNNITTKNNMTPPPFLEGLERELVQNLKLYLNAKPNAISKFIADGAIILKNNISVDNLLGNNFILSNGEFFYIDLGAVDGINTICEKNLFNFTVENICRTVYSKSNNLNLEIYKKQLELSKIIFESIEQNLTDQFIKKQYDEYMSKNNHYKMLIEQAYNNVDQNEKKQYKELYDCVNSAQKTFE